jgi:prefoldin subunit 5
MNNLSVLVKYIKKLNHVQARLQPNLTLLTDKARQIIRRNRNSQQ